jgi:hypothetical protein
LLAAGGVARATFPDFTGCTSTTLEGEACIDIQSRSGNLNIKGFNVPLHESLEIRGMLRATGPFEAVFVPPAGTNGFFSRPVLVPGGLLGIEWLPGNSVLAITELAGPASAININILTGSITIPVKVRLENLLLGMECHIGTNSHPVVLNLITGTTSPPPPNTPITGVRGRMSPLPEERGVQVIGGVNVENSFAVPAATECGFGLGLINALVDLKLQLPSAAGNNSVELHNDVALGLP